MYVCCCCRCSVVCEQCIDDVCSHVPAHAYTHTHMQWHTPTHTHSTITTLMSRMDKLETELENYKSVRLRHTTSRRPSERGEATPIYSRRNGQSTNDNRRWSSESMSSLVSSAFDRQRGPFVWQMPFTVKCIGTFRCVHDTHVCYLATRVQGLGIVIVDGGDLFALLQSFCLFKYFVACT